MVDLCRCQYCGQPTDRPMIFTFARQRIFNFIWDHPGCTAQDIAAAFYNNRFDSNNIEQHIYCIRKGLVGTGYQIANNTANRNKHARYTISKITPKPNGPANADVQSPNSLP